MDPDGGARRHGRRAAVGRDDGGREHPVYRVPAEPHPEAYRHALARRASAVARRCAEDDRRCDGGAARALLGVLGNAAEIVPELVRRGVRPDAVTDQTSAHDLVNGYLPPGWSVERWRAAQGDPEQHAALRQAAAA